MNRFRNESGAALVLTLMIITLILLFVLTLFYQIANTTKQVTTMEKQIISEQIAEMGVDYYRSYTKATIPETISASSEILLPDIELQEEVILDSEGKFKYWIETQEIATRSENEIMINFTTVGEAYGKITTIDSSITIQIESGE
ncbi:hypothetical protein GMD78_00350 [Ornithinibacillus sp. L9]|uniref:Type II secretion system protein n=1 Tax=Ornithinibacillus caprae TaxID=2678566 RepID=A0A6N8FCF5_9BACI|nr:hypothetical protein [Ornithinibacillus caprae]MUK86851.1 hypothetical protein [Ornithinibacillus caprae]